MDRHTLKQFQRFLFWLTLVAFWIPIVATAESEKNLAVIYEVEGDIEKKFNSMVLEKYPEIGFDVTNPHQRVNDQYNKKFGSTTLDILSFMSIVNDEKVMPLLAKDERLGGFSPFNMLIYKKLDDKSTYIGHLLPEAILDIVGIEDEALRKEYIDTFKPLDTMIEKEFAGAKKSYLPIQKMSEDRMIHFEYEFERPDDIDDFIEEFQNKFELHFIDKGYLIAGFHDFMEADSAEEALEGYDIFWTYSLCHLEFSYNTFDTEGARPEAGLFAPCSMYVYVKEESNTMVVGMPRLKNWAETLGINDEKRLGLANKLDREIPQILAEYGMKSLTDDVVATESKAETSDDAASETQLAKIYTIKGDIQEQFKKMVFEKYPEIGFVANNPHIRVNDQYKKKFGSSVLDVLSFMPIVNDEKVMPLLAKDERLGGFSPFNMLIYKKLDEENTHIGHLTPEAILDMVGIEDKALRDEYIATFKPLDELIEKEFAGAEVSYLPIQKMSEDRMIHFEYEFERPDDIDDFIEEFQNKFELNFIDNGYLIAGFHDFMEADSADEALEDYDIFWTYSLCHLEFSYNMFDNEGARPEAGLFAPCSMYVYVKADSNKMVVGMPRLKNWAETLGVTSEKRLALVNKLDYEIPKILSEYGMKSLTGDVDKPAPIPAAKESEKPATAKAPEAKTEEAKAPAQTEAPKEEAKEESTKQEIEVDDSVIHIEIPKPPAVPTPVQVKTISGTDNEEILDRSIKFSKRVPPGYTGPRYGKETAAPSVDANAKVGEVNAGRIAAHLRGELMEVADVEKKLTDAGFTVLGSVPLDKKGKLTSIVFTNKELTTMASKANRGFAASLRVLVNKKEKQISITNPLYMLKAFMQDDFNEEGAKKLLVTLRESFKGLKDSKDMLKYQALPSYQFMSGLPKYEDMVTVAKGAGLAGQLKGNKKVLFTQPLDHGATLVGVELGKRTSKFTGRIGTNNAAMLPYPILIENGEAKILEPKYYIAVMYPMLKMSQFMTIATVPGAMIKDCQKVFK